MGDNLLYRRRECNTCQSTIYLVNLTLINIPIIRPMRRWERMSRLASRMKCRLRYRRAGSGQESVLSLIFKQGKTLLLHIFLIISILAVIHVMEAMVSGAMLIILIETVTIQ